jgi:hypothetical protein
MIRLHCVFLSALIMGVLVWLRSAGYESEVSSRLPHIIQIDFYESINVPYVMIKHSDQCYTLYEGRSMSVITNQTMQDSGELFILRGNVLYCFSYPSYQNNVVSLPGLMSCCIEIGYLEDYIAGTKLLPKGYAVRRMFYRAVDVVCMCVRENNVSTGLMPNCCSNMCQLIASCGALR